jgi:hypothetical protein
MSYFNFRGESTMPLLTPKYELLVDLSKPVDETLGCIMVIANSQPGKQLEILREVELRLGEQIQAIETELTKAAAVQKEKSEVVTKS